MLNPKHVSSIILKTLGFLEVKEYAVSKMIKGIFAVESGLYNLYDHTDVRNTKHGFMMMSKKDIKSLLNEYVRYNPKLKEDIYSICGIDISVDDFDVILEAADTHIMFMVCLTYASFLNDGIDLVEDDLEVLSKIYKKYYAHNRKNSDKEFIEAYESVYR